VASDAILGSQGVRVLGGGANENRERSGGVAASRQVGRGVGVTITGHSLAAPWRCSSWMSSAAAGRTWQRRVVWANGWGRGAGERGRQNHAPWTPTLCS
jgi:hypothetical protein